jgi:hypothetical protein
VLGIVTNLSARLEVYARVKKRIHLNASFHREFVSDEEFIKKVLQMQEQFHINVNVVATPQNLDVLKQIGSMLRTRNISRHVDPYVDTAFQCSKEQAEVLDRYLAADRGVVDFGDRSAKLCSAGHNYVNVLPNGEVFTCAAGFKYTYSPLFADVVVGRTLAGYRMKNLFEPGFSLNPGHTRCALPRKDGYDRDAVIIKQSPTARTDAGTA